ncbi:MAG: tetratricopeptide repeat protein [Ottowia sp.]|uniref:tetratricopeptide repeat protein n=1 Tax=Ottowia sp. TaxID=1898956 RepID=UPI003C77EA3C
MKARPFFIPRPAIRRLPAWAVVAGVLALAGCGFKGPQGYGVDDQSTAVQAQQQMEKAELSTQVDPQKTYLNLITQMQQANQWYASLAHTEAFERQYGGNPQIRLLRADALRNTGQPQQAEKEYRDLLVVADTSTQARARRGLGLLYAGQKQYAKAVSQLESARQLNPIDADVLGDLAYAHMLDGRLSAASLPILQAAQLAPANARVQLNLALYWMASGEQAQAAQLLRRLQQPQAKNTPPLIDEASLNNLQNQLLTVQQAVRARADASQTPAAPQSESPATHEPKKEPPAASGTLHTVVIRRELTSEPAVPNTTPGAAPEAAAVAADAAGGAAAANAATTN